jgi:predicted  nucleic acid-binding Zn-ribbon protein
MKQSYDDYMRSEWDREQTYAEQERETLRRNAEMEIEQIENQIFMLEDRIEDIRDQINELQQRRHEVSRDL